MKKYPHLVASADLHLGHPKIIDYCKRPYKSVEEMDHDLLQRALEVVGPKTHYWFAGDFALHKSAGERFFNALPGIKHFVRGNHDQNNWVEKLGWDSIHDIAEFRDYNTLFVMCHYPMITWNKARYGSINLFGHIHNAHEGSQRAVNVGVDCWDYAPATPKQILERAKTLGPHPQFGFINPNEDCDMSGQV